jgi:hypothetical protein
MYVILQLKFPKTSNQASKQTNSPNSNVLSANYPIALSSSLITDSFLNFLYSQPPFPYFSLSLQPTAMWLSLQNSSPKDHQLPVMLYTKEKILSITLLTSQQYLILLTLPHCLKSLHMVFMTQYSNGCLPTSLITPCLSLHPPLSSICWPSHEVSALGVLFSFGAPSLSDLIHSYSFQHNLYPNSQANRNIPGFSKFHIHIFNYLIYNSIRMFYRYHKLHLFKTWICWTLMADTYNPSYLGDWDQEDWGSRPAEANSSWDPHHQNKQNKMD